MQTVLIIHGWSDTSRSFEPLAQVLKANGFNALPIWLGDYLSMEDEVSIPDVAKRMEEVLRELVDTGKVVPPFDMIVHSTGGLVARQWLTTFDTGRANRWLQRLVMLAPANYGSRLASLGKSMLGRLVKGFNNWFHTGTTMLNSLELGSPYQWQLALSDVLLDPTSGAAAKPAYGPDGCLPFVVTGIKGYDSVLRKPLNEDGADGTVRAAAANLTSYGLTLDFTNPDEEPVPIPWSRRGPFEKFAFRALDDVDHGSVVSGGDSVLPLILEALNCPMDSAAYLGIVKAWDVVTATVITGAGGDRNQYFQLNTFVVDDQGTPVGDHFLEFFSATGQKRNRSLSVFQTEIVEHVHVNTVNAACRTFYLDRTDLVTKFYGALEAGRPKELMLSISASPPGPNVQYFNATKEGASGEYRIHLADDNHAQDRWLKRNSTHFLKVIIPRRPKRDVFTLKRA